MLKFLFFLIWTSTPDPTNAFTTRNTFVTPHKLLKSNPSTFQSHSVNLPKNFHQQQSKRNNALWAVPSPEELNLDIVTLVAGQQNYGLAIVALAEGIWSFLQAPSLSNIKVLAPAGLAAIILVAVSGPLVTNASSFGAIRIGLLVSTTVSLTLGSSYILRLLDPYDSSS